ncbi:uncharacterized protein [Acropora muricata]|uniref:uncharacterized protein n=1 Tax=Acropora muricata TaxID=159855 RepID=UPI0034E3E0A2
MAKRGSSFQGTSGLSSQEATEDCTSLIPSRKLKVTLLGSEWGSTKAGLSTFNREFAIQLAKNENVEVSMYLPQCSEEDVRAAAVLGVCLLKAKKKPGYDPIDWLAWIPRDHRMDVVIGHGSRLGRQVSSIREFHPNCKWIQVVHIDPEELGMVKDYADSTVKGEIKHQAEVELCKLADQVVALGPKLTDAFACYLRSSGKDEDVINLTPGIFSEFANINQAAKERETFRVLVIGHGDSEDFCSKGYDIAARAVAKLKDEERSFKLVFVGAPDGEEDKVKERFLKESILPSQLIVRSAKERKWLAEEFCQADLVVMPSRAEAFGLAALEALSAGLPVLVSGNSGIGKALKKVPYGSNSVVNNLEFNNEDSKKWAEAIKAVCRKEREVRLEEAILLRQNYAKTYQWEGQCSTLVEKMCEMVKGTSTAPGQAVAAVNLGEQGRSSVSEAVFHPGLTAMQQHIMGDLVTSARENEIKRKRPLHPIVTTTERRQPQNALILEEIKRKRPLHPIVTTTERRQPQNALILEENRRKKPRRPFETTTSERQRQNADIPETDSDISVVVKLLKREYNRRAELRPLLWMKNMKLPLEKVYTRLRVVSRRKAGSWEIGVDDIFESSEKDSDPLVLVEGSPGIGKTTFCLKLVYDWANGAMPRNFPCFKLVFLLKCRDIIKDVVEEIFEQLLPEDLKEKTKEALVNFLEDLNNQEQILIILDGLDELPEESEDHVNKVLGRKKLAFCYVLATTREEKGIYTRQQFKFDICLAIKGFSEEDSFEYIRKHFRDIGTEDSSKGERLIEEVKQNPLLSDLQSNPLNLLLLCVVYEEHEGSLPSCITDLYQTIVRYLLRRYCAKEELKASEKDEDLDKQFEIPILALGELAWKCLLSDRLSFYEDELEELERSNENIVARRLGLVYKEESLKRLRPRHAYSFLHKTFQEYLAASHIAHKFRGSEFQISEQMLFPEMVRGKFKQVFVFVCGILGEEAKIVFEQIGDTLQKQWDWSKCDRSTALFFVDSWKETGNAKGMAKTLCSFLPFSRPLHVWTNSQCAAFCDVLKECSELPEEMTVTEVHISPYIVSEIFCKLMHVLEDVNKPLGQKLTFALFADVRKGVSKVPDFGLSSVRLRICGSLGSFSLQDVENLLLHKCLCSFSVTVCGDVEESLVEALARGLAGESAVKFLDLCVIGNFSFNGAYSLEQGILRNRSLRNIKVSVNGEPPENWQAVAKNLRAQFAEKAVVSEIYPNTFSKLKDSQLTHLNRFLLKTDLKQQTVTLNVWGELSGDGFKAVCETLLHAPVSHLTLNIHGQLTDEILRYIARCVEEQEKLSLITINAWVEMTGRENKLIKELGLDKNPSVSLNVRGTSAPLKESSDSNVVSCDKPQSLIAFSEKASKGSSSKFTEDSSQKSLTIETNDDKSNEWEYCLGEGLAGNTSLKSLTVEIEGYGDDNDEWGRGLGEGLARNTSLESLTIKVQADSTSNEWEYGLGEGLAGNTSLKSLTLEIEGYCDDNDEWGRGLGEGLARNTSLESPTIKVQTDSTSNEWEYSLGEGLAGNISLKSLTLEIDENDDGNYEWRRGLGEGLARNTSLESLTIKIKGYFTNHEWEYGLGEGLAGNTSLKSLTLEIEGYCDDNDKWGRGLGEGLARNTSLESLIIKAHTDSTGNEWEYGLGEGLAGNTFLKSLTLEIDESDDGNDEWGRDLFESLARNTSLESLTLAINYSEFGRNDEWGHILGESLAENNSLNSLTLTINKCNYMKDDWGVGLAERLGRNTSLKSITFTMNNYLYVSCVWGFGLFEGSVRNTSLKSITLSINNYGIMKGERRHDIIEGLARNTSLKSITLTINNYGDMKGEWGHDIIEGLARNASLKSITLTINNYGDMKGEWGHCLFEGLARNTSLSSFTLTANNYGDMSEERGCTVRKSLRKRESLTECNLIVDICGKC